MDVKDKVIIITGGASGIGAAMGKCFKAEGAKFVALADMDLAGAEAVAAEIGTDAKAYKLDVTDETAVKAVVDAVEAEAGPVDLYFSNAGIIFSDAPDWTIISQSNA